MDKALKRIERGLALFMFVLSAFVVGSIVCGIAFHVAVGETHVTLGTIAGIALIMVIVAGVAEWCTLLYRSLMTLISDREW